MLSIKIIQSDTTHSGLQRLKNIYHEGGRDDKIVPSSRVVQSAWGPEGQVLGPPSMIFLQMQKTNRLHVGYTCTYLDLETGPNLNRVTVEIHQIFLDVHSLIWFSSMYQSLYMHLQLTLTRDKDTVPAAFNNTNVWKIDSRLRTLRFEATVRFGSDHELLYDLYYCTYSIYLHRSLSTPVQCHVLNYVLLHVQWCAICLLPNIALTGWYKLHDPT